MRGRSRRVSRRKVDLKASFGRIPRRVSSSGEECGGPQKAVVKGHLTGRATACNIGREGVKTEGAAEEESRSAADVEGQPSYTNARCLDYATAGTEVRRPICSHD